MKNYYSILGLEQTNDMDEIKKTYRKLTMKYHPDKNCNNDKFTEKCKEINEAYDILGDKDKKKYYDNKLNNHNIFSNIGMFNIPNTNTNINNPGININSNANYNSNANTNANNRRFYKVNNILNNDELFNLFSNLNRCNNNNVYNDLLVQVEFLLEKEKLEKEKLEKEKLEKEKLEKEKLKKEKLEKEKLKKEKLEKEKLEKEKLEKEKLEKEKLEKEKLEKEKLEKEKLEKPNTIEITLEIDIIKSYTSCIEPVEITRWIIENNIKKKEIETIYVDIEKGIDDNEIIILEEKGNIVNNNKGDIKIHIKIINNTYYKRNGLDLIYIKNLTLKESLCGFNFTLNHMDGNSFQLINKKGNIILSNTTKILSNMGMKRNGKVGNLVIKFIIDKVILSLEQINKIEKIL